MKLITPNRFPSRTCGILTAGAMLVGWGLVFCVAAKPAAAQAPIANQPGLNQPPIGNQPGARRPPIANQPGTGQPPISNQPGAGRPPATGQPGTRPPATRPPATGPSAKPPATGDEAEEPKKPPAPQQHKANSPTPDGWEIYMTYYPPLEGVRKGKETPPVILLHSYGGRGQDFSYLAAGLQRYGYAVLVPDLRGHGRSTKNLVRDRDRPVTYESNKFNDRADITSMVFDVEKCRAFLRERNNAGELNMDLLCVMGAEMGAVVAVNWAYMDWNRTEAVRDMYRTGKNVKGVVLLSPERSVQGGANATDALMSPIIKGEMPILVAVGSEDRKAYSEAQRIYGPIEKLREKKIPRDMSPEDSRARVEYKKCFIINAPTTLQGTKLLSRTLPVNRAILKFLEWEILRVTPDNPWMERLIPGEVPSGT